VKHAVKVPILPESVVDAKIAKWHKSAADQVNEGDILLELETDKVMLEIPADRNGVLLEIKYDAGEIVKEGDILALLESEADVAKSSQQTQIDNDKTTNKSKVSKGLPVSPSARKLIYEKQIDVTAIPVNENQGQVLQQDVEQYLQQNDDKQPQEDATAVIAEATTEGLRQQQKIPMTRLRARIAQRLLQSQHETATLTTFNEINFAPVIALRDQHRGAFKAKYGVKLGFMSFMVKACCMALEQFPVLNAALDQDQVVYHRYCDIGIAVATERGLVVPVIRNAEHLSLAALEKSIAMAAEKARDAKLTIEDMTGGTFTITNGGKFGSLLSTPILNRPQSAILGMHTITKRPVVENDNIVARPMMYVALSYDHRIIDGSDAVQFLVAVKSIIEDPARLILQL